MDPGSHFKKLQFVTSPFHGSNRNLSMGQTQGTGDKVLPRSVDVPGFRGRCWVWKRTKKQRGKWVKPDEFKWSDWVAEKMEVCLKKSGEQIVVSLFLLGKLQKLFFFRGLRLHFWKLRWFVHVYPDLLDMWNFCPNWWVLLGEFWHTFYTQFRKIQVFPRSPSQPWKTIGFHQVDNFQ